VKEYYEDLWRRLPGQLSPPDVGLRTDFLLAHVSAGQEILDLGCGDGTFAARILTHAEVSLTAADVAEGALARARVRLTRPPAPSGAVTFVLVPFDGALPLGDNRFDLVWASEVIEHVADTGRWLSEVRRVLKPGARLLITTPNHTRLRLAVKGIGAVSEPLGDHLHLYGRRTLATVLAEFGFDSVEVSAAAGRGPCSRLLLASARR
jgi:ubiquinone/menaquinone biosynthesis C-methylase UbiE